MKILTYSDLHLEFDSGWTLPGAADGDLLILAGDIITFRDYTPLARLLKNWTRPVLYVTGNHEYYTRRPMDRDHIDFKAWLDAKLPHVTLLLDQEITIGGVNFFGGTMWTDFDGADQIAMETAGDQMNDFRLIQRSDRKHFRPADAIALHEVFVRNLLNWFASDLNGPRVVISHHAPLLNPSTRHGSSPLRPAFNSLDMVPIIEKYQPELWVYGHTHECDNQTIGTTRIISNQLGYPWPLGRFECENFDPEGMAVHIGASGSEIDVGRATNAD